ncbi:MAG: protein translocase subunit SecF [Chromatiales bacterium]|jgi:preprotein translocase subunit SecF|nr:protein translocase subunit SecF [Chromatiales bacterium]
MSDTQEANTRLDPIVGKGRVIDFMSMRRAAFAISIVLAIVAIVAIAARGLNVGVDFTGGTLIELSYPEPVELGGVREALRGAGYEEAVAQLFGSPRDVLVRIAAGAEENANTLADRVVAALRATPNGQHIELRRVEFVGPQVGAELAQNGALAVLLSLAGILIYIAVRFEKRLAAGAVLGLIHDILILVGIWAAFQLDFDLTVLAALLATLGYSLNDTIVIYDRIRENFRKMRKGEPAEIINVSVTQTLTRTIITSGTTMLALIALYLFGGEVLRNFSLVLLIGIVIGTISTIFVSSALALVLGVNKKDLMPVVKERSDSGALI